MADGKSGVEKSGAGSQKRMRRSSRVKSAGSASRTKSPRLIARAATASEIWKSVGLTPAEIQLIDRLIARTASRRPAKRASR